MKDLYRRLLAEEEGGADTLDALSAELREEIERQAPPEVVRRGFGHVKAYLSAF